VLLEPGADPGVTFHCRVHLGHVSKQEILYRKAQRTRNTDALPYDPTIYLSSAAQYQALVKKYLGSTRRAGQGTAAERTHRFEDVLARTRFSCGVS
jgi:hypothetical protein